MTTAIPKVYQCNGAQNKHSLAKEYKAKEVELRYWDTKDLNKNVNIDLKKFVHSSFHNFPDKILDLLEIASYVFAADRVRSRGSNRAVEFESWSRTQLFVIKVRDYEFWNSDTVKTKLKEALEFITGDKEYSFEFESGHNTNHASLFDNERIDIDDKATYDLVLFSGGLDSFAGALNQLSNTKNKICLVTHKSNLRVWGNQQNLANVLCKQYPDRIYHASFRCGLSKVPSAEETQRTRAFLYCSIAFSLSYVFQCDSMFAFENGITSMNFPLRQDELNSRASRTTHPKSFYLLERFFNTFRESEFKIQNPYLTLTKADVLQEVVKYKNELEIENTVSCSNTYQDMDRDETHCGVCSQCIDRRFASYVGKLEKYDNESLYHRDFNIDNISDSPFYSIIVDYLRQAKSFTKYNINSFYSNYLNELSDITGYLDLNEGEAVKSVFELCNRHGHQVFGAVKRMREQYDDLYSNIRKGTIHEIIADRDYLRDMPSLLASKICSNLKRTIPIALSDNPPKNENALNSHIESLLISAEQRYEREFPVTKFALSKSVPDFATSNNDLYIETKYIRHKTSPSVVNEGIAADITKYPNGVFLLFVVYDPNRQIKDDLKFSSDIESKRDCLVCIIR